MPRRATLVVKVMQEQETTSDVDDHPPASPVIMEEDEVENLLVGQLSPSRSPEHTDVDTIAQQCPSPVPSLDTLELLYPPSDGEEFLESAPSARASSSIHLSQSPYVLQPVDTQQQQYSAAKHPDDVETPLHSVLFWGEQFTSSYMPYEFQIQGFDDNDEQKPLIPDTRFAHNPSQSVHVFLSKLSINLSYLVPAFAAFGCSTTEELNAICALGPHKSGWLDLLQWLRDKHGVPSQHLDILQAGFIARAAAVITATPPRPVTGTATSGVAGGTLQLFLANLQQPLQRHLDLLYACGIRTYGDLNKLCILRQHEWDSLRDSLMGKGMTRCEWLVLLDGLVQKRNELLSWCGISEADI
ncbi:hypothetical protein WOLCODRAFT_135586 [Wolfiporia cocos MD-104 SS10]|uniref:Uncharacterized protein n=1 Tax=Wolfiporia cocos (strain MD-104) TaxID=742152 RepID=A0A2H3IXS4_WOLCO|nr:hypothetical protein WOLCODRAFT_135586 [Wolfiporia cocos MD-104 SS10]